MNNNTTLNLNIAYYFLNILASPDVLTWSCYKTHLLTCHHHHEGFNTVCKSTVNLAFLRLQPKRIQIQRIQQGTNNEGKHKEARRRQTKQWLIMFNILPYDK